jgi:N6-L-threonylcarbamoyladenine synthase
MLLAIESSCDESALALFTPEEGILWESVYSQIATHARHGGVVPELAVREHLRKFPELMTDLPVPIGEISRVAVTIGPGLAGSLAMGMSLAKAIALEKGLPLYGVNHLRAHAWSVFMKLHKENPAEFKENYEKRLPHLGMLVSGGNTLLYEIGTDGILKLLARTQDDAAGEALDKAAKMLGIPYPGAPLMEKLAREANSQNEKEVKKYDFPIPFKELPDLAFSFSGLKTSMRYKLQAMSAEEVEREKANLAASFQNAVIEALTLMVKRALRRNGAYKSIGLCGGVAQNGLLRTAMNDIARESEVELLTAEPRHCGDNAAMVAFAAWADPKGIKEVKGFEPGLRINE